jgi:hypothetical protein
VISGGPPGLRLSRTRAVDRHDAEVDGKSEIDLDVEDCCATGVRRGS